MVNVEDRSKRNNLLAYIGNVQGSATTQEARARIMRSTARYIREGGGSAYNKENLNTLQFVNRPLSQSVKRRRYDDLFEDFIEFGYLDAEDINTKEDLQEQLSQALNRNPGFDRFKRKAPNRFDRMLSRLSARFFETSTVQGFLRDKKVEKLRPATAQRSEVFVPDQRRERFRRLVRDEQVQVFRVFDEQNRRQRIIFLDRAVMRFRDLNTGRFAPNPERLKNEQ